MQKLKQMKMLNSKTLCKQIPGTCKCVELAHNRSI
jgi:hypothetical protein